MLLCFMAWSDVDGVPLSVVTSVSDMDLTSFADEIMLIDDDTLSDVLSDTMPKESFHPLSETHMESDDTTKVATLRDTSRRLLTTTTACDTGLCEFSCGAAGSQSNLPSTTDCATGRHFVNVTGSVFDNSDVGDFSEKCCVNTNVFCGTPSLAIVPAQRQQQHATDKSIGPNALISMAFTSQPEETGSGEVTISSDIMTGGLTAPASGWGDQGGLPNRTYMGDFVVPPHMLLKKNDDTGDEATFTLKYQIGQHPCEQTVAMAYENLGIVHGIAAYKLDYSTAEARQAYEKEVNGELLRSQGALRKQVQEGLLCKTYVAGASKTALIEALDMTACQVSTSCATNTDQCDLKKNTINNENPHLTWCADGSSSTTTAFNQVWQRGFAEAKVANQAAFLNDNVPNEGNQRGCAISAAGNFLIEDTISSESVKYMETLCQSQTNLQGTTAGTRLQTYRKQWGTNATAARQDRAPSIWHKPSESSQFASGGEQVAPIDFIITDEQVHSGQCVAGNEGSHLNIQMAESQMTQMDAMVCVRDSDQTDFLSPDDSYPKISNMFGGNDPDLRFEKYLVADGILGDAVVDGDYRVSVVPQAIVFQKSNMGDTDTETCFRLGSMTKAPLCAKTGNECGKTDVFQGQPTHTDGAHASTQAKHILDIAASDNYFYGGHAASTEYPSSRLLQASVSTKDGATIKLRLDGNETQLVDGPDKNNDDFDSCKYSARINTGDDNFQVKSKYGLRLRAKAGFQRQIAIRFTTYAEFGDITVRSGQLLSHDEANDLGATKDLVGKTLKRVATRTTPGMIVFQPYADGALTGECENISGHAKCGVYGQDRMDASIAKRDQFHVAATGDLQYYQPLTPKGVWGDTATFPDFQEGVTNGHVARYRDATGALKMSNTVGFDFVIHETTECDITGRKQSSIEQYFFNKKHCDSSSEFANVAEGKTGRAKFHVKYRNVDVQLIANEYKCGEEGWHHISKKDFEDINKARSDLSSAPHEDWGTVTKELLKSIQVQLPTDYSTQMCGDITYKAHVAVYDTRSCGMKFMELGDTAIDFMKYQLRTEKPSSSSANPYKYLSTQMDLRKSGVASTNPESLKFITQESDGELEAGVKVAEITFPVGQTGIWDGSSKSTPDGSYTANNACTPFLPFTAGCKASSVAGAKTNPCRFGRRNDNVARADQGDHVFASTEKPRDLDYLSSLEVTDLTNLVSWHKYDAQGIDDGFYSQLQTIIRHTPDNFMSDQMQDLELLANRDGTTANATFVISRTFEVEVSSDTVDVGEANANDARMGASRQMLSEMYRSDPSVQVPKDLKSIATGSVNRKVTRYSIFGSVDAFVAASGHKEKVFQKCIQCDTIAADVDFKRALGALRGDSDGGDAASLAFMAACYRSRAAMLSVPVATATESLGCYPEGEGYEDEWRGSAVIPHNQDIFLLTRAFPAFAPRPGWRDPIRIVVSLENYEWINFPALKLDGGSTLLTTREGIDFFTVLPQCNFETTVIGEIPANTNCSASYSDMDYYTRANQHPLDVSENHYQPLGMDLTVADGHWDGVCARDDTKGKESFTYDTFSSNDTNAENFEHYMLKVPTKYEDSSTWPIVKKVRFCRTSTTVPPNLMSDPSATEEVPRLTVDSDHDTISGEPALAKSYLCSTGFKCLARAFIWDGNGAQPANEKDARINAARLLTFFDSLTAAQQETLAAGDRCNRRPAIACVADADKVAKCSLDSYHGKDLDNIMPDQPGYDVNQNTFVRQYLSVYSTEPLLTDVPDNHWLLSQSNQRGSTMMHNKCKGESKSSQANTIGDWTSDRATEREVKFFPSFADGLGPTALSDDTSAFGVYESQECSAFTPSTDFATYPSVDLNVYDWRSSRNASRPLVKFSKNFNTDWRRSFAGTNDGASCESPDQPHTSHPFVSTGVQYQQTTETQTRADYGGSHIFVSTCKLEPKQDIQEGAAGTGLSLVVPALMADEDISNLILNSRTYEAGVADDIERFKIAWRDLAIIQEVDTPTNGNAVTGRDQYLFEFDDKNWDRRAKPEPESSMVIRSDTMVGGIGNSFDSNVLYGDIRPIQIEMDFTYNGQPINDLIRPYTVLTDIETDTTGGQHTNNNKAKVYEWNQSSDYPVDDNVLVRNWKAPYTFNLECNDDANAYNVDRPGPGICAVINEKARYQPTAADLLALSGVSEGAFLYTHSTHIPGLEASSFHQDPVKNGTAVAEAGYRRIVFQPLQKNLDFRLIKVEVTVTAEDGHNKEHNDNNIAKLTKSIEMPVVNVAGQAGICYHAHLTGEAGVVRPSSAFIVSDATNRRCLGEHTEASNSVGDEMASNLATTIAQSSVGSVDSFVPLPLGATSTTFSQNADFNSDGLFDNEMDTTGTDHQWEISCDKNTTCDFYQERAFLNLYASQPIQLAQRNLDNSVSSTNFTRFQPLDYNETDAIQTRLIKAWVLDSDINDAGLGHSDDIASLTKVSPYFGYSSVNNGIVTHTGLGADRVQYEVENPVDAIDDSAKWSTLAKGGQLYRLPIAQTTRTCDSSGNKCKVGFKLDGVHHMNNLFYAAGSEVKENNEIDIHAFITTFSQTSDGTTVPDSPWLQNINAVMAINGDGKRTRSQAVKWKARVYTTADLGGICVDNVAPIGYEGNVIDINYYGTDTSFSPKSQSELLALTADNITTTALSVPSQDPHINAGVAIISTKVLEDGNAGFIVEIKDKTAASSGNDWVSLTATRAVRVSADGNTFGNDSDNNNLLANVQITCHETVSEGAGYCADSGTSWAEISATTEARGKVGAGNPSEKFKVSLGNMDSNDKNAVGGHMMFCFATNFVNLFETRNLVKQCREFCVVAIDPDMKASTTCSAPGCNGNGGNIAAPFAQGSLGSIKCETTIPQNQAKRAGLVAKLQPNQAKAYLDMSVTTQPIDQFLISHREVSHHYDGNHTDLDLSSTSDVSETHSQETDFISTLGQVSNRLVTGLTYPLPSQVKIDYETKLSEEISIHSLDVAKFTGVTSSKLTLFTSTRGLELKSSAKVLKARVSSGEMCHGVETSHSAKSCPAQQTESTDLTQGGQAAICRLHHLAFATGYSTTRERACLVAKDETGHGGLVHAESTGTAQGNTPVTAATIHSCTSINLRKVGSFNANDILRTGLQAQSSTDSRKADLFPSETISDCSGGPGSQRSTLQKCRYNENSDAKITGKNGLYSFALDDLFTMASGTCTAGPGITIETKGSEDVSIVSGDDGLFLQGHLDTPSPRTLKHHLPWTSESIMETFSTSNNGIKTTTFKMNQKAVDYLCQLALHRKAIWFELKGTFSNTVVPPSASSPDDRFITIAFTPKTYQGVVSLDTNPEYNFDANQLLADTDNALQFLIKREENADAVKMLSHNAFGEMAAAYGTSRSPIAGSIADVWVRLKACAIGLVADRLSFSYDGPGLGAVQKMDGGDAVRLATSTESNEVCATQWIHVDATSTIHKLSLDLASRKGGGLSNSKVRLSLCDNIEKQTGCLLIKGASSTLPSTDQIHITTVSNENAAILYSENAQQSANGFATDGGISCGSIPNKCGLEFSGTCVSPQSSPGFSPQTSSSLKYTLQLRSSADTLLIDPSGKNIGQVEVQGSGAGAITVVSSHPGLCLEPMPGVVTNNIVGDKVDANCFVGGEVLSSISDSGVDTSDTSCRRVLTLPQAGTIKVRARVNLDHSVIDHLYVGRKCTADANSCRSAPVDGNSAELGARIAVVQLPASEPNVAGAHAHAIMSQFGMGFDAAPKYNPETGKITVSFQMGRYRPATDADSGTDNCWVDEDMYGQNDIDGHGFAYLSSQQPQTCTEWGDRVTGHGYSPRLMTIGVGEGLQIGKSGADKAFSRDHKSAMSCSPMRQIATAWPDGAETSTVDFAEGLFNPSVALSGVGGDNGAARATCQQMKSLFDSDSILSPPEDMGDYFSTTKALAYMKGAEDASVQPQWMFNLKTDKAINTINDAIRCGSRYQILGTMETNLNAASQCHHEDPISGNWVKSSTSTTATLSTGEEIAEVKIPITMRSYTATKARATGSVAVLHNTDAIKTDIVVYTKTSQSFTSVDVNLGRTTDLPRLYTEKVVLDPVPSALSDNDVKDGRLVHKGCYDDCQQYEGAGNDCSCSSQCQVAVTKDGDEIPNAFGRVKVYVTVEIPVADSSANGIEAGYVSDLRSFQQIGKAGVGGFNLKSAERNIEANDQYEYKTDATHSKVILTSVWKRLLLVGTPAFIIDSSKRPTSTSGGEWASGGTVAEHVQPYELLPNPDAFKSNTQCPCAVSDDTKWPKVEGFSAHAKCTFPNAVDFAFQLQVAKCGGDGVSAAADSGVFDPAANPACGAVAGEYKTVRLYLDYTNGQKFTNPKEIKEAARNFVLEGERVLKWIDGVGADEAQPYDDLTQARAEADGKLLDATAVLSAGQPYSLVAEIEDGDRILGSAMRLQQERSVVAVKHVACDPNADCTDGRVLGQCGGKLDSSDRIQAKHALAGIVLHPADPENLLPVQGDSAIARATFDRDNLWYNALRSEVRNTAGLPETAKTTYEVCYGGAPGGFTAKLMNQIPGKWCPRDRLKTAWDPAAEVVDFLSSLAQKSCGEDNVASHIWLCPPSAAGNGPSSWCYWVSSVANYDAGSSKKSCIVPSSITRTVAQKQALFDAFATSYRFLTVVDDFAFQNLEVRQNNLVPYADLGSKSCIQWSGVNDADDAQARYIVPGATGPTGDCSQMSQLVTTNFESNTVIRGLTPADSSFPIAGSGPIAARHIQCTSATKSSIFPSSASALNNYEHEKGRAIATRNGLRTDITFGSATAIPCVEKMVFMKARITDTRTPGVCQRAKLTCSSAGKLQVRGLSELMSAQGKAASTGTLYTLLKPSGNANDGNAVGGASVSSHPKDENPIVVPAQMEGWEFEIGPHDGGNLVEGSFSGRYKEASSTKGIRAASGVFELSSDVDSLTDQYNKYLYVNTEDATAEPNGFTAVSCGDDDHDVPLRVSDIQLGEASNLNGARRLLTVKTSDSRRYALRRTGSEQSVSVTLTTPAGAATETVCGSSGISCMPGYVWQANYDNLKCADNSPSNTCSHSYCCKEHTGAVHITNNAYHYSNKCTSLADSSTKRRITFMTGMFIAFLAILVMMARALVLFYRSSYCENGDDSNTPCRKPSLVAAAEVVSVISLIVAGIMGLIGQGSEGWIKVCGLDNSADWPVWAPLGMAALLLCYFALPFVHLDFHRKEAAETRRATTASSVPMNIL